MTTWVVLLLIPYLCLAVIGELPHQHGYHARTQAALLNADLCSSSGLFWMTAQGDADDDEEHCPLCRAQAAVSACAALGLPPSSLLKTLPLAPAVFSLLAARPLLTLLASRAPPALFS